MAFKTELREARKAAGLSQEFVAKQLGITRQAVGNWESDSSGSTPDPETLAALADLYGVSVDVLLGRTPDPIDVPHDSMPHVEGLEDLDDATRREIERDIQAYIRVKIAQAREQKRSN